jgi:hypothetical protein
MIDLQDYLGNLLLVALGVPFAFGLYLAFKGLCLAGRALVRPVKQVSEALQRQINRIDAPITEARKQAEAECIAETFDTTRPKGVRRNFDGSIAGEPTELRANWKR